MKFETMYFYIIMPIGSDPFATQKRTIIETEAKRNNMIPHFPKYKTDKPGFYLESTIMKLRDAFFVLADLSFERPSCYYELGLAEALGKQVYLIAKQGTDIHQTAARQEVIFYTDLYDFEKIVVKIFNNTLKS